MTGGFGARLRRHRESKHIDLATIAEQTKIKRSLLEALERDDVSQWPAGIFRRAWMRTYAQAIGLDVDETVRDFLEAHPDPEEVAAAEFAAAAARPDPGAAGLRGIFGAAFGSLSRRMRSAQPEPVSESPAPPQRPPSPPREPVIEAEPIEPIIVSPVSAVSPAPVQAVDLNAVARLCTRFGQAGNVREVQPLLQEVATLLDATGLIVWLWHSTSAVLRPALVHGYSAGVVARLPPVTPDDDNPTAASFRSGQVREIEGGGGTSGALVLPLLLRPKCIGVLAIELKPGTRLSESARAIATILAAAVAQLVSRSQAIESKSTSSRRARLAPVRGTA
jgi:transcriptional regulator with XRE-family HTH domain